MSRLTFIDLFCGCGGFTLGMDRAGFKCPVTIDSNPAADGLAREISAARAALYRINPSEAEQDLGELRGRALVAAPTGIGCTVSVERLEGVGF